MNLNVQVHQTDAGSVNSNVRVGWTDDESDNLNVQVRLTDAGSVNSNVRVAASERLINACGYHRRDAELADAKAALVLA